MTRLPLPLLIESPEAAENGNHSRVGQCAVIVTPNLPSISETFIRAHIERLPAQVVLVYGSPPRVASRAVFSRTRRAFYRIWRIVSGTKTDSVTLRTRRCSGAIAHLRSSLNTALPG